LVALAVFAFIYFIGWSAAQREQLVRSDTNNFEQRFAGSVIVPAGNDLCREFVLDNRTGDIRDGGYIKCAEAMRHPTANIRVKEWICCVCTKLATRFATKSINLALNLLSGRKAHPKMTGLVQILTTYAGA
jgi:hypothetical protein